ncbi:BrxA family protein [Vreelandella titanicae]|uniref:BrxA family protein n=1 Tax=Vreelandella titanicae TaxID=664683 RepID=UPI0039BEF633
MVHESPAVADLLLSDADEKQWHQATIIDNRLQKNRSAMAKRAGQAICKRLEKLEPPFWQALRDGDEQLATQVSFCASMARNLLLVEFLESIVADAFLTQSEALQA